MQRWCSKFRSLAKQSPTPTLSFPAPRRLLLHLYSPPQHRPFSILSSTFRPPFNASPPSLSLRTSLLPPSLVQVRHISAKDKKRKKARERKPMTPTTSKLKKIKMKSFSSFKMRFRTLNDGTIRRWREGKRHNAHLKSKKSKRRLRKPATVPAAYAKVMKKLNFCG